MHHARSTWTIPFVAALWACSNGPDGGLPESYRRLEVPVARLASAAAQERGRGLYLENCALCHGVRADGHGARRTSLSGPPADFTDPHWRARVTPRQLFWVIREGKAGTSMPAWSNLDDGDTWDVVAYLLALSVGGQ